MRIKLVTPQKVLRTLSVIVKPSVNVGHNPRERVAVRKHSADEIFHTCFIEVKQSRKMSPFLLALITSFQAILKITAPKIY